MWNIKLLNYFCEWFILDNGFLSVLINQKEKYYSSCHVNRKEFSNLIHTTHGIVLFLRAAAANGNIKLEIMLF